MNQMYQNSQNAGSAYNAYNARNSTNYWISLLRLFTKKSTLSVTLVDDEASVMLEIATAFDTNRTGGKVEAGSKVYNYESATKIKIDVKEIQTIVAAYDMGVFNSDEKIELFHQFNSKTTTLMMNRFNNFMSIVINNNGVHNTFVFPTIRINRQSGVAIESDFILFINILKSVINNLPLIKGGVIKERVFNERTNKSATSTISTNNINNRDNNFNSQTFVSQNNTPHMNEHNNQSINTSNHNNYNPQPIQQDHSFSQATQSTFTQATQPNGETFPW